MPEVKIAIVEDEEHQRIELEMYVGKMKGVEISGVAEDVEEAIAVIENTHPDIVLLDMRLYGRSAFEILNHFKNKNIGFNVIFISQHEEYKESFLEEYSIDFKIFNYLSKPFNPEILTKLITRYQERHLKVNVADFQKKINKSVLLNTGSGMLILDTDDIIYCTSDTGNNCTVYRKGGIEVQITMNIGNLEKTFPDNVFYRLDQSNLINPKYVVGYQIKTESKKLKRSKYPVCICNHNGIDYEIRFAKSKIAEFEKKLKEWASIY